MHDIRKDNRETPWMRQERMLLERRFEKAKNKAKDGDVTELMWIAATGQLPKAPGKDAPLMSKGMLDKIGEPNPVLDFCKCVAWFCAIGYLLSVGGCIAIWSMRFTPNQNEKWLGMGSMNIIVDWLTAKPIGAITAGITAALKDDVKGMLRDISGTVEYAAVKLKLFAEEHGFQRFADMIPVDTDF